MSPHLAATVLQTENNDMTVRVDAGAQAYDIFIGEGLLHRAGKHLAALLPSRKVCIVTDITVEKYHLPPLTASLQQSGFDVSSIVLKGGEGTKNFETLQSIINQCLNFKLDRYSTLVALGGGVVGDITGLAAALLMRGINFIQIPTTLLAQIDSSVGGKTGINTAAGKNLVGAFHQPRMVLIDTATLKTLPAREMRGGYAEILKYALINDPAFFSWLDQNGGAVLAGAPDALKHAIATSCRHKAAMVAEDADDSRDIRALLNLGHTFGHALEVEGGYDGRLMHGEAVSIGLLLAFELSQALGLCPQEDIEKLLKHLIGHGLMTEPPFSINPEALLGHMRGDKKNRNGRITLILARGIGKAFVATDINEKALAAFLHRKFG